MKTAVKTNRKRLLSEIQLDKQRLEQSPLHLNGMRSMIIRHLRSLEAQLDQCNHFLRSL